MQQVFKIKVHSHTIAETETRKEMLHATKWAAAANIANQGMSAATALVLAGILGPAAFGTVGLAYIAITFFQIVVGFGFNAALIQHRDTKQIHLSSVFWLNLALAIGLMLVVMAGSGFFAALAHAPDVQAILVALSVIMPVQGLSVVQIALLNKKMNFRALAIRSSAAVLLSGVVGLTLAFAGFGAWALVAQHLTREVVSVFLLWGQSDWRPQMTFSWLAIRDLSMFASKSVIGQFGTFVQNQFDSIIVGLFVGPTGLGLYRLADRLVELNLSFFPRAIQSVSLAHFSRLQHDLDSVNESFLFGAKLSSIATFPGLAYLAGSSALVLSLFGHAWSDAASVVCILALVGGAKTVVLFAGPTLQAIARPGIVSLSTWIGAVANATVILLVAFLLDGAADHSKLLAISGARALVFCGILSPMLLYQIRSATGLSMVALAKSVGPACLTAVLIFGSQYLLGTLGVWRQFPTHPLALVASLAAAFFTMVTSIFVFDRPLWKMLVGKVFAIWQQFRAG